MNLQNRKTIVLCGHNKCGTRWLAQTMESLDDIHFISAEKIRKYFDDGDTEFLNRLYGVDDKIYIDWPFCIQNPQALEFLTTVDKDMEAIIIYREPVDAMESFHRYQRGAYRKGYLKVADQKLIIKNKITDANLYEQLKSGTLRKQYEILYQYDKNLASAKLHFTNVHEFLYEDLLMDQASTIKRICNLFGRDHPDLISNRRVNVGMKVKSEFVHHLLCKIMLLLSGVHTKILCDAFAEDRMRRSLFYYLFSLNSHNDRTLNSQEISDLKKSYAGMVRRFHKLTSCNLEVWGDEYDLDGNRLKK